MESHKLKEKLNELEYVYQDLMEEYTSIDQVLQAIGFPYGLASLKDVAGNLISEKNNQINFDSEINS